jgi:hypothetical protein
MKSPEDQTNTESSRDDFLIWLIATLVFGVTVWMAGLVLSAFAPGGDGGLGFALGMVPSLLAVPVVYIGVCIWMVVSWRKRPEILAKRMLYYGFCFFIAGIFSGGLLILNGVVVYQRYFVH